MTKKDEKKRRHRKESSKKLLTMRLEEDLINQVKKLAKKSGKTFTKQLSQLCTLGIATLEEQEFCFILTRADIRKAVTDFKFSHKISDEAIKTDEITTVIFKEINSYIDTEEIFKTIFNDLKKGHIGTNELYIKLKYIELYAKKELLQKERKDGVVPNQTDKFFNIESIEKID